MNLSLLVMSIGGDLLLRTTSVECSAIRNFWHWSFVLLHRHSGPSVLHERSKIGNKIRTAEIAFLLEVGDATI
jgi:hypothetical protein